MNKRYMDFVPAKSASVAVKPRATVKNGVAVRGSTANGASSASGAAKSGVVRKASQTNTASTRAVSTRQTKPVSRNVPEVEIESLSSALYTDFPETTAKVNSVSEAKAKKIGGRKARAAARAAAKANKVDKTDKVDFDRKNEKKDAGAYKVPRPSFINQNRVVKRPLSKNVYQKQIETPVEKPQGPVTIIAKPEKDSKAGLIVTIIITIILGAAAGTVAFLLLPK